MKSPYAGRSFVFDLETNGLLDTVDRVHCAVAIDIDTEEVLDFGPDKIGEFLELYLNAKLLIGHNIIKYDCRVIKLIYGLDIPPPTRLIDTVNLARLVFPDVKASDLKIAKKWKEYLAFKASEARAIDNGWSVPVWAKGKPKEFPGYMVGTHSLEAWGYRMGTERKGDYSKEMKEKGLDPWASWNPEMHAYMIQDGKVNLLLFRHLMDHMPSPQSVLLEMRTQLLCAKIEENGWPFNVKAGEQLYMTLAAERDALATSLRDLFPPWTVRLDDFIPKRNNKTKGYIAGVPVERYETIEFNPASRQHIANRLLAKYGWEPTEYTDNGQPKVDDDVLSALEYPEAKALARFFVVQKRIGQLAEGRGAWLKKVDKAGFIRCRYNTNGASTGRATHSDINVSQVPSIVNANGIVPFGRECRELFTVPKGWRQLGADQAGLELRGLGAFMAAFDGGAYINVVLNGDVHWENAKALFGLPADTERYAGVDADGHHIEIQAHEDYRSVAKRFIYAFLYGSGDMLLGELAGVTDAEAAEWSACPKHRAAYIRLRNSLYQRAAKYHDEPPTKQQLRWAYKGSILREAMMANLPALGKLIKFVKKAAKKKWLKGLDGRAVPVRSEHSALNALLQSAGAIICKQWICDAEDLLLAAGLKHGWDGDFAILGWIHDEIQIAVAPHVDIDLVSELVIKAAREARDPFPQWKCPTDGDTKVGLTWADCH